MLTSRTKPHIEEKSLGVESGLSNRDMWAKKKSQIKEGAWKKDEKNLRR